VLLCHARLSGKGALVIFFWITMFGVQQGDVLELLISNPSGQLLVNN